MTREEAKQVFLARGYVEVEGGTIFDANKWREACGVISEWLEQEPSKDMEEIEEVINCNADAEIKLKMISNIVHSKPHYFKVSHENKIIDEHYWKGFNNGIRTAEWRATKQEPTYCDRNICLKNEYSDIGCEECEVTKSQEPSEDAVSRQEVLDILARYEDFEDLAGVLIRVIKELPSVKPQPTGHWIIIDDCELFMAKCSECGQIEDSRMIGKYAYCHCGARMESEKNEHRI